MIVTLDYRKRMYHEHPLILEGVYNILYNITLSYDVFVAFYTSCTMVGILGVKDKDLKDWNSNKN